MTGMSEVLEMLKRAETQMNDLGGSARIPWKACRTA